MLRIGLCNADSFRPFFERAFLGSSVRVVDARDWGNCDVYFVVAFRETKPMPPPNKPFVLMSGEPLALKAYARHPNLVLTFDCKLDSSLGVGIGRTVYVPQYVFNFRARHKSTPADLLAPRDAREVASRPGFCAFMYWVSYKHRDEIYHAFRRRFGSGVRALGRACSFKTTSEKSSERFDRLKPDRASDGASVWDRAVETYRGYRFVLVVENCSVRGYVTEKIVNAMLAGCVPVYYGAPDIADHFNTDAMVIIHDLNRGLENALQEVNTLSTDPAAFARKASQPWFRDDARAQSFLTPAPVLLEAFQWAARQNVRSVRSVRSVRPARSVRHTNRAVKKPVRRRTRRIRRLK